MRKSDETVQEVQPAGGPASILHHVGGELSGSRVVEETGAIVQHRAGELGEFVHHVGSQLPWPHITVLLNRFRRVAYPGWK